jgi:hypothetical protein
MLEIHYCNNKFPMIQPSKIPLGVLEKYGDSKGFGIIKFNINLIF